MFDVVTLGETMIRFTPSNLELIEQSNALSIFVGGSESNTSVGLARLGVRVAWISRLTRNPLGLLIASQIAAQGVDVSEVVWTEDDRVGTYYMERGAAPRNSQVFYDRANSAISRMLAAELPSQLAIPGYTRLFHTTGITAGISATARDTALQACRMAKAAGGQISFDVNYRAKLWSTTEARNGCEVFLKLADLIFLPLRDAALVFGVAPSNTPEGTLNELHARWPQATIVITQGVEGASAIEPSGEFFQQAAFASSSIERLGSGDAFSAGYLYARSQNESTAKALLWGNAAAAIKLTIPGDLPLLDARAVRELVSNGQVNIGISR